MQKPEVVVEAVSKAIRRGRVGLKDPKRPIWLGKDKFNFDNLDYISKQRLLYTPDQPILLAMSIYPYVGFTDEFPQAAWRTFDGKKLEIETKKGCLDYLIINLQKNENCGHYL